MEVGPPANNHYLSVAWVAQVRRQLPLSGPVPAHVKEDLDHDKYYNHSETQPKGGDESDDGSTRLKECMRSKHLLTCTSTAP